MQATDNKYLRVLKGVVMTAIIEPVIIKLDPLFEEANLIAYITSGLRMEHDQLRIIRKYLKSSRLDSQFEEAMVCGLNDMIEFEGSRVYAWQPGWSKLLSKGIIVNPPKSAKVLYDYWRNSQNRKGDVIGPSPHFKGTSFDIGGGDDITGVSNEMAVMQKALKLKIPGLKGILVERNNNAVHVDCIKI